jgi:hypothetical protein
MLDLALYEVEQLFGLCVQASMNLFWLLPVPSVKQRLFRRYCLEANSADKKAIKEADALWSR